MVTSKRRISVVSAAIIRSGRYLITQRTEKAVLPSLWEFPGGKVEPGETDEDALRRELRYRLGVEVHVRELLSTVEREYEEYIVELHLYRCELPPNAEPTPSSVQQLAWVGSDEFDQYVFTPADQASMDALLDEL